MPAGQVGPTDPHQRPKMDQLPPGVAQIGLAQPMMWSSWITGLEWPPHLVIKTIHVGRSGRPSAKGEVFLS
jgi:hypothetical protein